MRQNYRWNHRDAVSGLGKCQQVRGRTAFDQDFRLQPGKTAGSIECPTNQEARVEQKQRMRGYATDLDCPAALKWKGRVACGQEFHGRDRIAREVAVIRAVGL